MILKESPDYSFDKYFYVKYGKALGLSLKKSVENEAEKLLYLEFKTDNLYYMSFCISKNEYSFHASGEGGKI